MNQFENTLIFLRVVEEGNFTTAASRLRLPLSSVSRRIRVLEDAIGVRLLYRTTRRVSITDAGKKYYEACKRAEEILEEAWQSVHLLQREPEGTLRVLAPIGFGLTVLEPGLVEFRQRFPKIQVIMRYDRNPLDLIEHGFDVALRVGTLPDSQYSARRLGYSRAQFVASPAYLDHAGRPTTPHELAAHPVLLMNDGETAVILRLLNESHATREIVLTPVISSNESITIIRQALAGVGIALISRQLVSSHLGAGKLEVVLPTWHRANDLELSAVFPEKATADKKIRVFVDFLSEIFSALEA